MLFEKGCAGVEAHNVLHPWKADSSLSTERSSVVPNLDHPCYADQRRGAWK